MNSKSRENAIRAYTAAGFILFPCRGLGADTPRAPRNKGWQKTPYNADLKPGDLPDIYGVIIPDDVLVLDYDPRRDNNGGNQLVALWRKLKLPKLNTFIVQSGGEYEGAPRKGLHLYFRVPQGFKAAKTAPDYPAIDIKGSGGYVCGAGSLHETGGVYKIYRDDCADISQLMEMPEVLLQYIQRKAPPKPNNVSLIVDNSGENQNKFIAFLKSALPAIQGRGGDHATFLVAAKGKDYGLSEHIVCGLMLEHFNPRCSPPWELRELEIKVSNAFRYTQGVQGNQHPEAILAQLDASISQNINNTQQNKQSISTITAIELMQKDFPKPRWAVKPILPEGLTVIAGSPKIGKSWMAYSLACAVSVGGKALGAFQASQGKVLYLALEDNLRRLQDRLRKLSDTYKESVSEHLMLANSIPRGDDGGLKILEGWLDAYPDCRLVIIDTLARFSAEPSLKMNAYENDYRALAPMQRIALSKGIALVVITHLRKQSTSDPLEQVTGSAGITGVADAIWLLKRGRGEARGTLKITGRDVEEQELAVQFDTSTCHWAALGDAVEYRLGKERKDILDYIKKAAEPVAPKEVAEALGAKEGNVKSLMRKMFEAGQLGKKDRGKYIVLDPFADYEDV